jgi:hypothetical protein
MFLNKLDVKVKENAAINKKKITQKTQNYNIPLNISILQITL